MWSTDVKPIRTPSRLGSAAIVRIVCEEVRNLQRWTCHERRALGGRLVRLGLQAETLQRAHDRADGVGGDVRIERRRVDLRMSERT